MIRSIELALREVSADAGVSVADIRSGIQTRTVVRARHDVCALARALGASLHEIGEALGRDHSTVRHGSLVAVARRQPDHFERWARAIEDARRRQS